ncbi:MAG: hypothetical protein ABJD07_11110 [Gemmatimonadaceae bacterium]
MKSTRPYDIAISCVGYDVLTAKHLAARLRARLNGPIYFCWERTDDSGVAERALKSDARVVVVLHQRLWGETDATRADEAAIEKRVGKDGDGKIVIIALENTLERRRWMPRRPSWVTLPKEGMDAAVDAVMTAVERAGGTTRPEAAADSATRHAGEDKMRDEHDAKIRSAKAMSAASRELGALMGAITKRVETTKAAMVEADVMMHRTPDRLIVQAGRVGLSVSWLRSRTNNAEGSLLIIDWDGTVTLPGKAALNGAAATVVGEQSLQLDPADLPESSVEWRWVSAAVPTHAYSSQDLADQCVDRMLFRLKTADPKRTSQEHNRAARAKEIAAQV